MSGGNIDAFVFLEIPNIFGKHHMLYTCVHLFYWKILYLAIIVPGV
jgi:hypothetical protein